VNVKYNGVSTTAFSGGRGWPKYCDSRVKVATGATPTDYQRAVLTMAGNTDFLTDKAFRFSNMPVFADNIDDPDCVYQKLKSHVSSYDLTTAAGICGCSEGEIINVAIEMVAHSRFNSSDFAAATATPGAAGYKATTLLYAMGGTQHTNGSQNIRAYAVTQTFMGNMGRAGGGINALRGIHNVQGSTDMGLLYDSIPAYSSNPSVGQKYANYSNALFGNRVVNIDGTSAGAKDPYAAAQLGLQQRGFYNMTKHWFGDTSANVALPVVGEAVTMTGVVWNNLVHGGAKSGTVVVTDNPFTTTYVEGTDYKVDSQVGALMRIATGTITAGQSVLVNYSYDSFDKLWDCWPKGNGLNHLDAFRAMETGTIKASVVWGQNPAVTEPNQSHVRAGLKNLDLLVCVDMFENETAAADRKAGGVTYQLRSLAPVARSRHPAGRQQPLRPRADDQVREGAQHRQRVQPHPGRVGGYPARRIRPVHRPVRQVRLRRERLHQCGRRHRRRWQRADRVRVGRRERVHGDGPSPRRRGHPRRRHVLDLFGQRHLHRWLGQTEDRHGPCRAGLRSVDGHEPRQEPQRLDRRSGQHILPLRVVVAAQPPRVLQQRRGAR
jgi:hypothetical protein